MVRKIVLMSFVSGDIFSALCLGDVDKDKLTNEISVVYVCIGNSRGDNDYDGNDNDDYDDCDL